MAKRQVATADERDLAHEIDDLRDRHPVLKDDELFALWFLLAFVTDDEVKARRALTGGPKDQGIDALLVDDEARQVVVVQTKYRQRVGAGREARADLTSFAGLAQPLVGSESDFQQFVRTANPSVAEAASQGRQRVLKRRYNLQLYYVTTGAVSKGLREQVQRVHGPDGVNVSLHVLDGPRVLLMLRDYLDGVAPPVPSLDIELESGDGMEVGAPFSRFDGRTGIESWILSVRGSTIGELYDRTGIRLFARNVRGYLGGTTDVNRDMTATILDEPNFFWYYNNGVTVICDEIEEKRRNGRKILAVANPQVINGQQTTRTLAAAGKAAAKTAVLLRIIKVPRESGKGSAGFDMLVSQIVAATNRQNAIKPSDLMANDRRQIAIERALRKCGYLYVRKRQTKGEAKRSAGLAFRHSIKKDELAQAVAACDLDPVIVRQGKEGLFEEGTYGKVFPTLATDYYLTRYWLVRVVGFGARGRPERAYAKWLVAHALWQRLSPQLRTRGLREQFQRMGERTAPPIGLLDEAVTTAYQAALALFRRQRGSGPSARDVSSFFKRKGLDAALERFLRSGSGAKFRRRMERRVKALVRDLQSAVDGEAA